MASFHSLASFPCVIILLLFISPIKASEAKDDGLVADENAESVVVVLSDKQVKRAAEIKHEEGGGMAAEENGAAVRAGDAETAGLQPATESAVVEVAFRELPSEDGGPIGRGDVKAADGTVGVESASEANVEVAARQLETDVTGVVGIGDEIAKNVAPIDAKLALSEIPSVGVEAERASAAKEGEMADMGVAMRAADVHRSEAATEAETPGANARANTVANDPTAEAPAPAKTVLSEGETETEGANVASDTSAAHAAEDTAIAVRAADMEGANGTDGGGAAVETVVARRADDAVGSEPETGSASTVTADEAAVAERAAGMETDTAAEKLGASAAAVSSIVINPDKISVVSTSEAKTMGAGNEAYAAAETSVKAADGTGAVVTTGVQTAVGDVAARQFGGEGAAAVAEAAQELASVVAAVNDELHNRAVAETMVNAANEEALVASVVLQEDAILNRILEDVRGDVPEPRAGISRNSWVVTGKATDGWSSYNSFPDGSFGAGVRDFYGAGGSMVMQGDNFGRVRDRINSLYPGFGTSGSWLTQPRQSKEFTKKSQVDGKKLLTQLWASIVLKDNIVTVFGYILNVPHNPLTTDLYTSLYYIYDALRMRRVSTFELIRVVEKLGGLNPNGQFLVLFKALKEIVPSYLESAVNVWIVKCQGEFRLLDKILRPGGGPLVVDFLAGIDSSVMEVLSEKLKWNHSSPKDSPNVKSLMGARVFEDIFISLSEGKLELTQQLFAILLMHRPINDVVAQRDETERYLVDVLRMENVRSWDKIVKNISPSEKREPDKLITTVLRLISESKDTDPVIREDARYLRPYIRKPTITYANKNFEILSGVISKPSLDLLSMLKLIRPREYPRYIVNYRNQLMEYILEGQLNVEFIIKGFNRFDHVSPINVLIALLTRITRRLQNLPKPIMQSVKSIQLYLLYKKFSCTMSPQIPVNLVDFSAFMAAYDDPFLPKNVTILVNQLATLLPEEKVPWEFVAKQIPLHRCVRPRQCVFNMLCLLVNKRLVSKGRTGVVIRQLVKLLNGDGNPKDDTEKRLQEAAMYARINARGMGIALPNLGGTWPSPIALPIQKRGTGSTDDAYLMEVEIVANKSRALPFPPLNTVQQEEPALLQYPATCLPPTINGTKEYDKLLPALYLLSWERLPSLLGDAFPAERYVKKGELLLAILEALNRTSIIKRYPEVHLYVQSFSQFIQSYQKRFKADSVVYFPSLLNALPAVEQANERQYLAKLRNYFTNAEFYKQLGPDFDPRLYKTRGEMLKYVLELMLKKDMAKWDPTLKAALQYYAGKIFFDGYGAQEVEWALLSEAVEPTYVDMTVFRVLDHSKMTQSAIAAEYEVLKFIFTDFIPNVHLRDLNVKKFKTKAQFLKGTFGYLLTQQSVNPRIKEDIRLLMQYIRMDGRGAEPLDYNEETADL